MAVLEGILFGIGTIVFIGPVFFLLLKSSIESGKNAGLSVAVGIIASDIVCIYLCSYFAPFLRRQENLNIASLIGAALLIAMGIKYIMAKPIVQSKKRFTGQGFLSFFTKGFLINFINPFVFVVWMGIILYTKEQYYEQDLVQVFYVGVLMGIFFTDAGKVYLAQQIKRKLTPIVLQKLYKIIGVLLIAFSLRLVYYFFTH
jgi:threonine/homoserine/homoserine lactone efflux protein